MVWSNLTVFNF